MLHDPNVYEHPDKFNPDRFLQESSSGGSELKLDHEVPNPMDAAFGFGRRICPGRHMTYESLWMSVASFVAVFDIKKSVDEQGNEITPSDEYELGFLRCAFNNITMNLS